ncbi:MAG: pilin [Candidatus Shapirobacteria bacterium]|jgi:TRAP-type C4-dicarboxylate transport system permease small subunit|nr:pilin [Candidatus Shapirobacteria bacterium]MDD4382625.1 pilin [Candidatus Shapirobacteria bacterium]
MKKTIVFSSVLLSFLLLSTPALAASADVSKIQTFMQSVIQVLVTLAGLVSAGFFVWGGIGYITSSGDPEKLDKAKKTIVYSAIGLVIVLGAFVISTIVTQLATGAFGSSTQ